MKARVTSNERLAARQMAREVDEVERIAVAAITRAIAKGKSDAKRLLRDGVYAPGMLSNILMSEIDELTDAVLVSYLLGRRRAEMNASLSLSANSRAIKFLADLFSMTDDEIEEHRVRYRSSLMDILKTTGSNADKKIQESVMESLILQEHISPAMKRLDEAFKSAGIDPKSSFQIENIFRTQCQMAYSGAKWQANNEGAFKDMLWGYRYVTVGDNRVRPNHAALDGVTLPKDDPRWDTIFPPNGYACRCQAIEQYRERKIVEPPAGGVPDEGFAFNPGKIRR